MEKFPMGLCLYPKMKIRWMDLRVLALSLNHRNPKTENQEPSQWLGKVEADSFVNSEVARVTVVILVVSHKTHRMETAGRKTDRGGKLSCITTAKV
jgi:hypothetical protein